VTSRSISAVTVRFIRSVSVTGPHSLLRALVGCSLLELGGRQGPGSVAVLTALMTVPPRFCRACDRKQWDAPPRAGR